MPASYYNDPRPPRPTRPGSSSSDEEPLPIGVPAGFTTPVPVDLSGGGVHSATAAEGWASQGSGHGTFKDRPPRYFEGDEWRPAQLGPTSIAELQRRMAQAGLLSGSFRLGAWDEASRDAYTQLLGFANAKGLDAENALGLWASGVNVETDADGNIINEQGPVREPLVTQTTDPESLRRLFRSTVVEQLGEGWDTEKINLAVKTYNALEEQRQREMYDAQLTGGNVVSIPDPASYIAEQAIKENPEGHETEQALGFMDEFMSMAQGNGWS